ncbi:hypothetical protein BDW02DRAFT_573779 [Decorospora gaudefroyi]|uniref:Uncharacterized protein n=1 Tax=Decorospora gaudefroyi TaxID=184978 RepID=A0A6A5K8F8_9PLEO|nr:hypothetical protein BDW02DRAFT_573779 [Decorospora gaudefroyi]
MNKRSLLWALLALLASAQENNGVPVSGPFKPGFGGTPESQQVMEAAGRHPNATSTVTFARTFNNEEENWTWRINITELNVPNSIYDLGMPEADFSEGLKFANVQWQLQWPGSESGNSDIRSLLAERNATVMFGSIIYSLPANVTDSYSDDDKGDCAPFLGEDCARSVAEDDPVYWQDYCEGTLNVNIDGIRGGVSTSFDSQWDTKFTADDTLFFHTTDTYTASGEEEPPSPFEQAESALNILIFRFRYDSETQVGPNDPTALCRIVRKSMDSPEQEETPPSAAVSLPQSMMPVWVIVILAAALALV